MNRKTTTHETLRIVISYIIQFGFQKMFKNNFNYFNEDKSSLSKNWERQKFLLCSFVKIISKLFIYMFNVCKIYT